MPQISVETTIESVNQFLSKKMYVLALDVVSTALQENPSATELQALYGKVATESRDFYTAANVYDELVKKFPKHPVFLMDSAKAWSSVGETEKAILYSKRAIQYSNSSRQSVLALADLYERNNMADEAEGILDSLAENIDGNGNYQRLKARLLIAKKRYAEAIDYILSILLVERNNTRISKLCFLLSKSYDRLGDYDKAWDSAQKAHKYDETPFDEHEFFTQFDKIRAFMTKETVEGLVEGPTTEVVPFFIVSNPRSGTSLLEQIVGMHSDVANGGEMPTGSLLQSKIATMTDSFHSWPMNLIDVSESDASTLSRQYCLDGNFFRGDAKVVSNKALNLHLQLGFLSKILPSSKAILLQRSPLDNAVSCYMNNLIAAGLTYTNKIEHIGRTWIERKKMSEHWLEVLSIPMMEMSYEHLVANQRSETERLIRFLDLPWQEECMQFHTSKHVARTISYDQVNKEMYSSSSGRWKNYEKHLGPLIDIVSEYI